MKNKNSKKHFWFLVWGLGNGNCAEILKCIVQYFCLCQDSQRSDDQLLNDRCFHNTFNNPALQHVEKDNFVAASSLSIVLSALGVVILRLFGTPEHIDLSTILN